MRRNKDTSLWKITTFMKNHNHDPIHDVVLAYQQRVKELTDEQTQFIVSLLGGGVPPEDVLACYRLKYKNGALITAKDIVNLRRPMGGGSTDAYQLLQKLQQLQSEDPRWFVRFKVDNITMRLSHLFWMSPRQRDHALDLYQVVIHDNTYKTNRFKLPCGLFSAPNRYELVAATSQLCLQLSCQCRLLLTMSSQYCIDCA